MAYLKQNDWINYNAEDMNILDIKIIFENMTIYISINDNISHSSSMPFPVVTIQTSCLLGRQIVAPVIDDH